jgi:hypothetical protein
VKVARRVRRGVVAKVLPQHTQGQQLGDDLPSVWHPEQVLELGNQGPATTSLEPYHSHL